jgi:hypothetical protein
LRNATIKPNVNWFNEAASLLDGGGFLNLGIRYGIRSAVPEQKVANHWNSITSIRGRMTVRRFGIVIK